MSEELIGQELVQHCVRYTIIGFRKPKSMEYYWSNFHQRVWQHQGGIFDKDFKAIILSPKDKKAPHRCGKFKEVQYINTLRNALKELQEDIHNDGNHGSWQDELITKVLTGKTI